MSKSNYLFKHIPLSPAILFILYIGIDGCHTRSFEDSFAETYTKKDLIDNFNKRERQIRELKSYFRSIVPTNSKVEIEFNDNSTLSRFGVSRLDTSGNIIYPIFLQWELSVNSDRLDSVIKSINWTQETLKELKTKLDSAHCISINSEEPCQIGFQRSGMGMYFYDLFDKPIPDTSNGYYNDSCKYIIYHPTLVLEYGGGAMGPQCFPKE